MAHKTNSALTAAGTLVGTEKLYLVQGGNSRQVDLSVVATYVVGLITDSAPSTLDTLNELAAALGDDPNFAATVTAQLADKADTADLGTAAFMDLPLSFNFSGDSVAKFHADEAMTLTQTATDGTGAVAYEKSTAASPGVYASTTSPITLEAGANLKVIATGTDNDANDPFMVSLKRTA